MFATTVGLLSRSAINLLFFPLITRVDGSVEKTETRLFFFTPYTPYGVV